MPIAGTPLLGLDALAFVGTALVRPECVLATRSGELYTADWRGGVARIDRDGTTRVYTARLPDGGALKPNGIALRRDGTFLVTHLGDDAGGVFVLDRSGGLHGFLSEVEGVPLPPTNFVHEDGRGRVWITVSTRQVPRVRASRPDVADGFVVLVDARGPRIVADGLGYTNEAVVSPDGRWLYVNETFGRRLSRFEIRSDDGLGARETVAEFGPGTFPDGLTFDAEGGTWITSIVSNRVIRVDRTGRQTLVLEDSDPAHLEAAEAAYRGGTMGRQHLDYRSGTLKNVSSLAFGGPDLRTAYLGCLLGERLATFAAPVAGHPPSHWNYGPFPA